MLEKRDFDTTPAQYADFVQGQIAWANWILSQPVAQWPRGSSHELARQLIDECQTALEDLRLDGKYFADGTFAGY